MKFKTSLFNRNLVFSDIKRFWWVGGLNTMIIFFMLPFYFLVAQSPGQEYFDPKMYKRFLDLSGNNIQLFLICIVPVLVAVLVFKYLNTAGSVAMMHSLPYTKKSLFFSHTAAGLLLLLIPILFNALVLVIIYEVTFIKEFCSLGDIGRWTGDTLLFTVLFYAMSIFVGMFTGNAIAQIVFFYILNILPLYICMLVSYNLGQILYGYADILPQLPNTTFTNLPLLMLLDNGGQNIHTLSLWHVIAYIFMAALFFGAAYISYKKRRLESAGDIVVFSFFRPVFKYGVAFCAMLFGGMYFASISDKSFSLIVFGYILGSFLGYWIAEILLQKSFRVWAAYKGYLVYLACVLILLIGVKSDILGYESRVPEATQVEKVYFGGNLHYWVQEEKGKGQQEKLGRDQDISYYNYNIYEGNFLKSRKNIEQVIRLHKYLILQIPVEGDYSSYIIYTLKNGKHLMRQYPIDVRQPAFLKPLYESLDYKKAAFPILTQDLGKTKYIEIQDDRTSKGPLVLTDSEEKREFTKLFRQELTNASFGVLTSKKTVYTNIRVIDDQNRIQSYAMPEEYQSLFNWLKEKGYYNNVVFDPSEVIYVVLEKRNFDDSNTMRDPQRVKITDPKVIKELLESCANFQWEGNKEPLTVMFYNKASKGQFQFEGYLAEDTPVSESLRSYLKQLK